jgi:methylthioribulose-1-phosphate dehydratase
MNGYHFTQRVRRDLQSAREAANALGNDYVGPEHMLLGLIREREGNAVHALTACHVDLAALQSTLEDAVRARGATRSAIGPDLPYTRYAKRVLERALQAARDLDSQYVGTEHLLLGLLADDESEARRFLHAAGVTAERIRTHIPLRTADEDHVARPSHKAMSLNDEDALATELAATGRRFYDRGWVFGTSGNFSAVLEDHPLRLAITASGIDKRTLSREHILRIDEERRVIGEHSGKPSAEAALHLEIVSRRGAGAVLHTHSVWSTMLSDAYAERGGLAISGLEMLKGLDGVGTHEHREWVPIVANDQDMASLARRVGTLLDREPRVHGFLLRGHGLYTWGRTLAEAERHVEIFEFLFETIGRRASFRLPEDQHGNAQDPR